MLTVLLAVSFLVVLPVFSTGCTDSEKRVRRPKGPTADETVARFARRVNRKDYRAAMQLLQRRYVQQQHDQFLKGNTPQFIRELLSGKVVNSSPVRYMTAARIDDIRRIDGRVISRPGKNSPGRALFKVSLADGQVIDCTLTIIRTRKGARLVGASG